MKDMSGSWAKENKKDKIWWWDDDETVGEIKFTFDKKKVFYLYRDYSKLNADQKYIFDKENPYWAEFFRSK